MTMGVPCTPSTHFSGLEHYSGERILRIDQKKYNWNTLNLLPTHPEQDIAIYGFLVIFTHFCMAMGDPWTPSMHFSGQYHCTRGSILHYDQEKRNQIIPTPSKPTSYQAYTWHEFWTILPCFCTPMAHPYTPPYLLLWLKSTLLVL